MHLMGHELHCGYGAMRILHGATLGVEAGEIVVIVEPNGAGKSTAMKALLGMMPLNQGKVTLADVDITNLGPEQRIRLRLSFVPQTDNVFPSLTVRENLEMGAYLPGTQTEVMDDLFRLFPILAERQQQPAGQLFGGQRQQVAIARALMTRPQVLLLDEPTAGVSPAIVDELFSRIIDIKARGVAILMVEQNARQALGIADRGYVLVSGKVRYEGAGTELLADSEVRRTFLGGT